MPQAKVLGSRREDSIRILIRLVQTKQREQGEHMMSKEQERWQRSDAAEGLIEQRRHRINHIDVSG